MIPGPTQGSNIKEIFKVVGFILFVMLVACFLLVAVVLWITEVRSPIEP